ncbi:unnamed protein product, partial [Effrenium voratum]
ATPMRRSARSVNSPVPPGPLPPQVHSETTAVWTAAQKRPVRPWSSKWEPQKHREGLFWGWWRGQYERKGREPVAGAFAERKVSDPHWRSGITWSKGWDLAERRKRAQASLQAVPCLGDATLRERWQQHIEASLDPERDAKRIHWMISRLQMPLDLGALEEGGKASTEKMLQQRQMRLARCGRLGLRVALAVLTDASVAHLFKA